MSASAATLTVDLDALAHNFRTLRDLASGAEVAPVVKADGYGLGAGPVARRLHAEGARTFYVARVAEGVGLRRSLGSGREALIRVLDGCPDPAAADILTAMALTPVLSSLDQVDLWSRAKGDDAALMVDTGMNRLGLRPEEAEALATSVDRLRRVEVRMVLSHLACAEDPGHPMNGVQRARLTRAAEPFPGVRRSLANSAGVLLGPAYALDEVRPGIALYGGGPRGAADPRFRPVATFTAPILQVRTVPRGESVGYGAAYLAPETMPVAIVAAGYADGVLRAGAPGLYGVLDGRRLPVLGRISMDLLALDARNHPAARPGARVELLGANVNLDAAAAASGTIAYELLTRLAPRAERRHLGATG